MVLFRLSLGIADSRLRDIVGPTVRQLQEEKYMNKRVRTLMRIGILGAMCVPVFAGTAVPAVPEPATMGLIGAGLATVLGIRYYRSRKR